MLRTTALSLVLAVSLTHPAGAQTTIDFLALDDTGRPVEDLTSAEIEIKIDGKLQKVSSLDHIRTKGGGRHILLLLEEATVYRLEPVVKEGVQKLLQTLLPGDEISFISTRRPSASVVRGAAAIGKALDEMLAGPGVLHSCLSDSLRNIEQLSATLPPGRGSTLVLLARGHPEGSATGSEGDAAPCTPRRDAMRKAAEVLGNRQINVMLFTIDETNRSWGFETLAANIGATSRLLTFADTDALHRALAETRSHYRATIDAANVSFDRPLRVELKTRRRDVKIHTSPVLTPKPRS